MYRLQQEIPHNYQTGNNKRNTCFARRWKDIAVSEDFFALAEYAVETKAKGLRIVDTSLTVVWAA